MVQAFTAVLDKKHNGAEYSLLDTKTVRILVSNYSTDIIRHNL